MPRPARNLQRDLRPDRPAAHPLAAGLLRLTRWREHLPFTVPVTLLGAVLALQQRDLAARPALLAQIVLVLAANILAVTVAFMINDVEDADDDAHDPDRAARNPVSSGEIAPHRGRRAAGALALLALALYAAVNVRVLATGALTLALGWLYSWRAVRLKAWPVVDVLAHLLMLSALLFLAGYLALDAVPGAAWWAVAAVGSVSGYGQLYNQLRDYDADRRAGLHNTASIVGRCGTARAMYGCLALAGGGWLVTLAHGLWPPWLLIVIAALVPLLWRGRARTDMRGSAALDLSGEVQGAFFALATGVVLLWLAERLIAGG